MSKDLQSDQMQQDKLGVPLLPERRNPEHFIFLQIGREVSTTRQKRVVSCIDAVALAKISKLAAVHMRVGILSKLRLGLQPLLPSFLM